jgi:hypothetical protein
MRLLKRRRRFHAAWDGTASNSVSIGVKMRAISGITIALAPAQPSVTERLCEGLGLLVLLLWTNHFKSA